MRKKSWAAAAAALLPGAWVFGCGEATDQGVAASRQAVESAQRGAFYDVAFAPARSLSAIGQALPNLSELEKQRAYVRELASLALPYWSSGSITVPALTQVNGPVMMAPAPATSRIRYSCGATLVSPSYVITAGHCPTSDTKLDELELQMYRPSRKLVDNWQKTVTLSGSWPELTHPKLDEADGYIVDRYKCTVKTRCYEADVACQNSGSDVAMLECAGRPGDKYGFINVSTSAPTGKEALMHWKHEVLDVHTAVPMPTDYVEHYVKYPATPDQNFHYFESENQLLALRSIPWPDGSSTKFINATQVDVHGCHGSSGSGILAREGTTNEYRLVGPAALGGPGLSGRLCEQVPNPGGAATGPGTNALGVNFKQPQMLLDQYASAIGADCKARAESERDLTGLPFTPGSHRVSTLFGFLACQVDAFAHTGSVSALTAFGPYPEKLIDDASSAEISIGGFELEANADYRAALQAQSLGDCLNCASPELRVGGAMGATAPLVGAATLVSVDFAAEAAGAAEVRIKNDATRLAVGGFTLIRQGQVNSFDTPEDRLEAALYALNDAGGVVVGPAPMRFAGDGEAGFEAQLLRGERMALLRQALGPSHRWTVRLGASSLDGLECGLLGLDGETLLRAPCEAVMAFDDRQGSVARLGFFVELANGSATESVEVKYVAIASDSARDDDADQVPEVLDNCPGDWNAAQGDCSEEPPAPGEGGASGAGGEAPAGAGPSGEDGGAVSVGGAASNDAGAPPSPATGGNSDPGETGGTPSVGGIAGSGASTSGATSDGGTETTPVKPKNDSSCSCSVPGEPRSGAPAPLLLLTAALATTLRRKKR